MPVRTTIRRLKHVARHSGCARRLRTRLEQVQTELRERCGRRSLTVQLDAREPVVPEVANFRVFDVGRPFGFGRLLVDPQCDLLFIHPPFHLHRGARRLEFEAQFAHRLAAHDLAPRILVHTERMLVFDHVHQFTLADLAQRAPRNIPVLLRRGYEALQTLHGAGFAHLDPNWGNVFLTGRSRQPIFIDFDRELGPDCPCTAEAVDYLKMTASLFEQAATRHWAHQHVDEILPVALQEFPDVIREELRRLDLGEIARVIPRITKSRPLLGIVSRLGG